MPSCKPAPNWGDLRNAIDKYDVEKGLDYCNDTHFTMQIIDSCAQIDLMEMTRSDDRDEQVMIESAKILKNVCSIVQNYGINLEDVFRRVIELCEVGPAMTGKEGNDESYREASSVATGN